MSSQAYLPDSEMEKLEKLQIFQTPLCLIKSDTDGKLSVVEATVSQLEEILYGVNVVAIAGLYRTGKSYLMNRLAHVSSGFALGNATEAKTKGIWVWCKRHPTKSNQVLVLLDTEGLGDVSKGDIQNDNQIFTLAALLSSTLVYNMMGAFNQDAVEKLTFITEMSKNMKVGEGMSADKCLDFVLPRFVLCLRDFCLELEAEGRKITPDEYLEHCLKSKQVQTPKDESYNRPRECIRRYFTRRRVFTFDRPGGKKVMTRLESAHDDELSDDFVEDTVKFTSFIFQCEPKMLIDRKLVSGSMLAQLVREYVKSMREGGVPCVEDAMTTMARKENENLVKKAVSEFEENMKDIQLPIYNSKELLEINFRNQKASLTTLVKGLVFDDTDEAKTSAEKQMNDIARLYEQKNDEMLQEICVEKLEGYYKPITEKISNDEYNVPGGYQNYKKDMSELEEKYFEELQSVDHAVRMKVLKSFLDKTRKAAEKVLENDQQMTEQEKEKEPKERKARASQKLKESQTLVLKELEKQKLDLEEKMRRMMEKHRQKEDADFRKIMEAIMQSREQNKAYYKDLKKEHKERKARASQKLKESQDLMLKELEKQKQDLEEKMRRMMEKHRQKEDGDLGKIMEAIMQSREQNKAYYEDLKGQNEKFQTEKELKEREATASQKLKESQALVLKELEKQKLDHEEKMRRIMEEQRQKEHGDLRKIMEAIMQSKEKNKAYYEDLKGQNEKFQAEKELKEREATASLKPKKSQDLMLIKFEKQKLDHEEKMRRMMEEQRQKEETDLRKNMEANMQAREQNKAYFEDLRRQNEKFQAENKHGVSQKAWDYLFRT